MKKMQLEIIFIGVLMFSLVGCGSTLKDPKVELSGKFRISNIEFEFIQHHNPDIEYHTKAELETMTKSLIMSKLNEKGLLSTSLNMDSLDITINYARRFVGDQTPIPSDSLAYPVFAYEIKVKKGEELLALIKEDNLNYNGGFVMNLKVMAGSLRDKSYENDFVNALANSVVKRIEKMK